MKKNKVVAIILSGMVILSVGSVTNFNKLNLKSKRYTQNNILLQNLASEKTKDACVINGDGNLVLKNDKGEIISYVSVGESLKVQSISKDKSLVMVKETGVKGYIVNSNLLTIYNADINNLVSMNSKGYIINVSNKVNLREEPSMMGHIIEGLGNNTKIDILGKAGQWYKVSINGQKGFIFEEYIAKENMNSSKVNIVKTNINNENTIKNIDIKSDNKVTNIEKIKKTNTVPEAVVDNNSNTESKISDKEEKDNTTSKIVVDANNNKNKNKESKISVDKKQKNDVSSKTGIDKKDDKNSKIDIDTKDNNSYGWHKNANGQKYFINSYGEKCTGDIRIGNGKISSGWKDFKTPMYHFNKEGIMQTGWSDNLYYGSDGIMQTGWLHIDGKYYFFWPDGEREIGLVDHNAKKYWLIDSGQLYKGFKDYYGENKYFGKDGSMVTGWQQINNKRYYFSSNGDMEIGWTSIDSKTYYFNESGIMLKGNQLIDGKKYDLGDNGILVGDKHKYNMTKNLQQLMDIKTGSMTGIINNKPVKVLLEKNIEVVSNNEIISKVVYTNTNEVKKIRIHDYDGQLVFYVCNSKNEVIYTFQTGKSIKKIGNRTVLSYVYNEVITKLSVDI